MDAPVRHTCHMTLIPLGRTLFEHIKSYCIHHWCLKQSCLEHSTNVLLWSIWLFRSPQHHVKGYCIHLSHHVRQWSSHSLTAGKESCTAHRHATSGPSTTFSSNQQAPQCHTGPLHAILFLPVLQHFLGKNRLLCILDVIKPNHVSEIIYVMHHFKC